MRVLNIIKMLILKINFKDNNCKYKIIKVKELCLNLKYTESHKTQALTILRDI